MSQTYFVVYPNCPLTRGQILDMVLPLLKLVPVRFDNLVGESRFDSESQSYVSTTNGAHCDSPQHGLTSAETWRGVGLPFSFHSHGHLSLEMWNDDDRHHTTLALEEDSLLVSSQDENSAFFETWNEIMFSIAEKMGSSFFVFLSEPYLRTLHESEIVQMLDPQRLESQEDRIVMLAVRDNFVAATNMLSSVPELYVVAKRGGYFVIRRKDFGTGPKDD